MDVLPVVHASDNMLRDQDSREGEAGRSIIFPGRGNQGYRGTRNKTVQSSATGTGRREGRSRESTQVSSALRMKRRFMSQRKRIS